MVAHGHPRAAFWRQAVSVGVEFVSMDIRGYPWTVNWCPETPMHVHGLSIDVHERSRESTDVRVCRFRVYVCAWTTMDATNPPRVPTRARGHPQRPRASIRSIFVRMNVHGLSSGFHRCRQRPLTPILYRFVPIWYPLVSIVGVFGRPCAGANFVSMNI